MRHQAPPKREEFYVHLCDTKEVCRYCPDAVFVESNDSSTLFLQINLTEQEFATLIDHKVFLTRWSNMVNKTVYH